MTSINTSLRLALPKIGQLHLSSYGTSFKIPITTRSFFSLPSFPRATHDGLKTEDLTLHDRYSKRGDLLIYKETKRLPYSKQQLYSVIADIEAYDQFVPHCKDSKLISHHALQPNEDLIKNMKETKPWVNGGKSGEIHLLDHETTIGFKTFEERYTSHVECRKWDMVKASANPSSLFKSLTTTWTFHSPDEISTKRSLIDDSQSGYVSLHLAFASANAFNAEAEEFFWKSFSQRMVLAFEKQLRAVYDQPSMSSKHSTQPCFESVHETRAQL